MKYDQGKFDPSDYADTFHDTLSAVVFEMNHILMNTTLGQGIVNSFCSKGFARTNRQGMNRYLLILIQIRKDMRPFFSKVTLLGMRGITPDPE